MEPTSFEYSTKNIAVSTKKAYVKRLIENTEQLIRNLRWLAFFFLNPNIKSTKEETYHLKSTKTPPMITELSQFETKMQEIVTKVDFNPEISDFQRKLSSDVKAIKNDTKLIIKADKTNNFYKLDNNQYDKLMDKHIQAEYKKATKSQEKSTEENERTVARSLKVDDRLEITAKKEAFITLKDHKPNFKNKAECRLINPTKTEIGKVSKNIIEKLVTTIMLVTSINLWRSTKEVISWFSSADIKKNSAFISFDIVSFYPSISEKLLNKALTFSNNYSKITEYEKNAIIHAKKILTLLKK